MKYMEKRDRCLFDYILTRLSVIDIINTNEPMDPVLDFLQIRLYEEPPPASSSLCIRRATSR